MLRCLSGLLIFLVSWGVTLAPPHPPSGIEGAWYYPMQWDTVDPLFETSIRGMYDITSCVQGQARELRKVLTYEDGQDSPRSGGVDRLVIDFRDGTTFVVNKHGQVWSNGKRYALGNEKFRRLKMILKECLPPPPRAF